MTASNGGFMHPHANPVPIPVPQPIEPLPVPDPPSNQTIADAMTAFLRALMRASGFTPSPALVLLVASAVPALIVVIQSIRDQLPAQWGAVCGVAIVVLGIVESALTKTENVAKARIAATAAVEHMRITSDAYAVQMEHHAEIARLNRENA